MTIEKKIAIAATGIASVGTLAASHAALCSQGIDAAIMVLSLGASMILVIFNIAWSEMSHGQ